MPDAVDDIFPSPEHARWGLGVQSNFAQVSLSAIAMSPFSSSVSPIYNAVHPQYTIDMLSWMKWRLCYEGGDWFVEEYLYKFSSRESNNEFRRRKLVTPTPTFAKGAINEIKNSIFQRASDISRTGGPRSYQEAVEGRNGGVDLKGGSMNWYLGHYIIPEMLVMRKVGVYVDNLPQGPTRAQNYGHPYIYIYRAEDIRSWAKGTVNGRYTYTSILLREYVYLYSDLTGLPIAEVPRYRHVYLSSDSSVCVQFYDQFGNPSEPLIHLSISEIPFVEAEISESLMKDIANHQIALMNLESSDVSYCLKGNIPLYTEQFDSKNNNPAIKAAQQAYQTLHNEPVPVPPLETEEIVVGSTVGRRYGVGLERPGFINPSSEPIKVSMEKQSNLKSDIRALVFLAVASLHPVRASAESKNFDRQGLESGLAYIGLELEHCERAIARFWSMYEGSQEIPTVIYPQEWAIKSEKEREERIIRLKDVRNTVPSNTLRRELNKEIASEILGTHTSTQILETINSELDAAPGISADPKEINLDLSNGTVSQATAAALRGYGPNEVEAAAIDHAARLARIQAAQVGPALHNVALTQEEQGLKNPAARGIPDLSPAPTIESKAEKQNKSTRGEGQ